MTKQPDPVLRAKVKLSPNGRIVIPAPLRERMGVTPGETLLLDVEDGVLRIETYARRIKSIQDELAQYVPPGVLLSEELIAERRREEEEMERDKEAALTRKAG